MRYDGYDFNQIGSGNIQAAFEGVGQRLWVGSDSGVGYVDFSTDSLKYKSLSLPNMPEGITAIAADRHGSVLLGTAKGLYALTEQNGTFEVHPVAKQLHVYAIVRDAEHNFWLGTDRGLFQIPPDSDGPTEASLKPISFTLDDFNEFEALGIHPGQDSRLWLVLRPPIKVQNHTRQYLVAFDPRSLDYQRVATPLPENVAFDAVLEEHNDRLWIGTDQHGLYQLRFSKAPDKITIENSSLKHYVGATASKKSTGPSNFRCLVKDRSGSIWGGSDWSGLYQIPQKLNLFKYQRLALANLPEYSAVSELIEDNNGNIWIGTYDSGIVLWDRATTEFRRFLSNPEHSASLGGNKIYFMYKDREETIWALSDNQSLNKYHKSMDDFVPYKIKHLVAFDSTYLAFHANRNLQGIAEDRDGNLWLGSSGFGILHFDTKDHRWLQQFANRTLNPIPGQPELIMDNYFVGFSADRKGAIWASSFWSGLYKLQKDRSKNRYTISHENPIGFVVKIHEDEKGRMWLGTMEKGLVLYDRDKKKIIRKFGPGQGVPNYIVWDIIEDPEGMLWIITPNALTRFNPKTFETEVLNEAYDLNFYHRLRSTGIITSKNELMVGGVEGLYYADLDKLKNQSEVPPLVHLNGIWVNESNRIHKFDESLHESHMVLGHSENNINFSFTGIHLDDPTSLTYDYILEGADKNWIKGTKERIARYSDLQPGDYTFRVRAGIKNVLTDHESSFKITIKPAWWQSNTAKMAYLVLLLAAAYVFNRAIIRQKTDQLEKKQLLEMNRFKSNLYTNITHEFRTPLTVIGGLSKSLREKSNAKMAKELYKIERNADNLLFLVNEMLELQMLESSANKLHLKQGNIAAYLKYLIDAFRSIAEKKQMLLEFYSDPEVILMDFDEQKIRFIVYNLVHNAIKFTPVNGQVKVRLKLHHGPPETLELLVRDTGLGIPESEQDLVFDRFYQVERATGKNQGGSGIGLAVTKEMVQLLNGNITLESKMGKGSKFMVHLPVHRKVTQTHEVWQSAESPMADAFMENKGSAALRHPLVLIVEDHDDVAYYIADCLKTDYRVLRAPNGDEGVKVAFSQIPDIIISDIMMPVRDGYELTQTLKAEFLTDHIPIILLSAKTDLDARLEGYRQQADGYLTKPFEKAELRAMIKSLLETRKKLQAKYRNLNLTPTIVQNRTDRFLERLNAILEEHLDDEAFGISDLAEIVGASRVQLYRKLKALTGSSPARYIRDFKLERALILLRESELNVSQTAFAVGYKSRSLFSRHFADKFGYPPSSVKENRG